MLRTGHLIHPAPNPASQPSPGASLPGTLASPQTGLTPAGCPELLARLHHDNLLVVMAPELLGAREVGRWLAITAAGAVAVVAQRPPIEPCMRFSRTRLSDTVHREACAGVQ
jgi:hypothetical protein